MGEGGVGIRGVGEGIEGGGGAGRIVGLGVGGAIMQKEG